MKFYYYCMNKSSRSSIVVLRNMLMAKPPNNSELNKLREEEVKLFEITECSVSPEITDLFYFDKFCVLNKDGIVKNNYDAVNVPPIKSVECFSLTKRALCRGVDGKLYDKEGKEQTEIMLLVPPDTVSFSLTKDGNVLQLLNIDGTPCKIPLARLKDMSSMPLNSDMDAQRWMNTHIDWQNDLVEAKSKRILFGSDGTCLFDWNGIIYSVAPQRNRHIKMYAGSGALDAVYREDYEKVIDDIAHLVADKIYIDKRGNVVFMDGWNDYTESRCARFEDAAVKAQKWGNLVQCEVLGKHLVGKTKDGRILTTFEPEICGNLKNIDHAFVSQDFAFFVVK